MKLTPWIRCKNQQPSRTGWYDVLYPGEANAHSYRYYWNGNKWLSKNKGAKLFFGNRHLEQGDSWRGLAEDPSKAKK